jgi:peptidoglycan-associated lipoprotein
MQWYVMPCSWNDMKRLSLSACLLLAACVRTAVPFYGPQPPAECSCAAPGSEQYLVGNVGDRVYFASDRSSFNANDLVILDNQAAWMTKNPANDILVAGNADERGTETYNLALGQRRADAVRDYLIARNVASARIQTISYGKDCPIALGHFERAWAVNRTAITSLQGFNLQSCAVPKTPPSP